MTTESTTQRSRGDAEASACCGAPASATVAVVGRPAPSSPCCGTTAEAEASGTCCGSNAKQHAITSGAGCCADHQH